MTSEEKLELTQLLSDVIKKDVPQLVRAIVKEELVPINERLDKIEDDLEELKEYSEVTRDVTNSVGEWIDFYFKEDRPYPVDKMQQ